MGSYLWFANRWNGVWLVLLAAVGLFVGSALFNRGWAQEAVNKPEGPNWCQFATQYLKKDGKPLSCSSDPGRCVRMNNYGCIQNPSAKPYDGQVLGTTGAPLTDLQSHVVFEHPKWSLLKAVRVVRQYYVERNKRTALAIAETWAPWCDTNGTLLMNGDWGRTCKDNKPSVPATFEGPRCERPPNGVPKPGQCGHCNCPNQLAAFYVKDVDRSPTADLGVFDSDGKPTPVLVGVVRRVLWMETGYQIDEKLIKEAVESFKP